MGKKYLQFYTEMFFYPNLCISISSKTFERNTDNGILHIALYIIDIFIYHMTLLLFSG